MENHPIEEDDPLMAQLLESNPQNEQKDANFGVDFDFNVELPQK